MGVVGVLLVCLRADPALRAAWELRPQMTQGMAARRARGKHVSCESTDGLCYLGPVQLASRPGRSSAVTCSSNEKSSSTQGSVGGRGEHGSDARLEHSEVHQVQVAIARRHRRRRRCVDVRRARVVVVERGAEHDLIQCVAVGVGRGQPEADAVTRRADDAYVGVDVRGVARARGRSRGPAEPRPRR